MKRSRSSLITSISILVLGGLFLFGGPLRQAGFDWLALHNYTPPTAIAQLASDTTMTDKAEHLYYINHPELKDKSTFSNFCNVSTEQTVVLGCYKGGQEGIYLLKVDNAELAGIQQVTAAHEMLHAAYERLSDDERGGVGAMLQDYYDNKLTDQTIKDTIDSYKKTEPEDLVNEMHSILGTQIADLPAGLSDYYKQYFTDRSKVTNYYAAYQQAFTSRQRQITDADQQLNSWKTQIDQLEVDLKAQEANLQRQRAELNRDRSSGNIQAYNNGVDDFNKLVADYNATLTRLQSLISDYNKLVENRNSIAFEERQLAESLSSSEIQQQ